MSLQLQTPSISCGRKAAKLSSHVLQSFLYEFSNYHFYRYKLLLNRPIFQTVEYWCRNERIQNSPMFNAIVAMTLSEHNTAIRRVRKDTQLRDASIYLQVEHRMVEVAAVAESVESGESPRQARQEQVLEEQIPLTKNFQIYRFVLTSLAPIILMIWINLHDFSVANVDGLFPSHSKSSFNAIENYFTNQTDAISTNFNSLILNPFLVLEKFSNNAVAEKMNQKHVTIQNNRLIENNGKPIHKSEDDNVIEDILQFNDEDNKPLEILALLSKRDRDNADDKLVFAHDSVTHIEEKHAEPLEEYEGHEACGPEDELAEKHTHQLLRNKPDNITNDFETVFAAKDHHKEEHQILSHAPNTRLKIQSMLEEVPFTGTPPPSALQEKEGAPLVYDMRKCTIEHTNQTCSAYGRDCVFMDRFPVFQENPARFGTISSNVQGFHCSYTYEIPYPGPHMTHVEAKAFVSNEMYPASDDDDFLVCTAAEMNISRRVEKPNIEPITEEKNRDDFMGEKIPDQFGDVAETENKAAQLMSKMQARIMKMMMMKRKRIEQNDPVKVLVDEGVALG